MRSETVKHITLLLCVAVLAKLLMVLVLVALPVEDVADRLNIEEDLYSRNWRILGWVRDERPLLEKLGYTFDSRFYVELAKKGYRVSESDVVFMNPVSDEIDVWKCTYNYPFLYPLLIRFLSPLVGYLTAGLSLSNLSSIIAIILFYMVSSDYIGPNNALKACILLTLYPYNLTIWMTSFSEPVYLAFVLGSWMLFTRKKLIQSGFLLMLASLTRYAGFLLFPIYSIIYVLRERNSPNRRELVRGLLLINVFSLPLMYWMFMHVPNETGYTLSGITSNCNGYRLLPVAPLLEATFLGLFFTYFAFVGLIFMRKIDRDLTVYSLAFILFHVSVVGTGGSIGRYLGVIWPLFIYYGRKLDYRDVGFFSAVFLVLAALMIELQANMISWI